MSTPRWRRLARLICGLALIPPALWLFVVLLMPTGWARRRIAAELEARTGRRVDLGGVSIGPMGGIRLSDLVIGSKDGTADPWLKAAGIRLDFGLLRLIGGGCRPSRVDVNSVELRVLRRGDGILELADLLRPVRPPSIGPDGRIPAPDPRVDVRLHRSTVTIVDEPSRTRLRLENVEAQAYTEGPLAVVERLGGNLNGGEFRLRARVDRTVSDLAVEGRLRVDGVALDDGMNAVRYVVPVLAGASKGVRGRLAADFRLRGRGQTWPALVQDLSGRGGIALDRVAVDGAPMVAEVARIVGVGPRRLGSVRATFAYGGRRISTDHLTLKVGSVPIVMTGWTDIDGRLDYTLKIAGLDRLPAPARRLLGELKLDAASPTSLALRGTLDRMDVELDGKPVAPDFLSTPRLKPEDREDLRMLGRQLRDSLIR